MDKATIKKLAKVRDRILWEKWFINRGKSIWSDIPELLTLTTIVGLFVNQVNSVLNVNLDVGKAMIFTPLVVILYSLTGKTDYKFLHLIQKENEIAMQANPALYEKIRHIEQIVEEIKKETDKLKAENDKNKLKN